MERQKRKREATKVRTRMAIRGGRIVAVEESDSTRCLQEEGRNRSGRVFGPRTEAKSERGLETQKPAGIPRLPVPLKRGSILDSCVAVHASVAARLERRGRRKKAAPQAAPRRQPV
ncbi:hypothetical protein VTK73DRAFT_4866 [Phialemonium thermophilum]|uniref:Uncharacterized protein n=1 Tax=Phialemonium thermophilum TaxID=223376 RepID=A0ABR3V5B7_9PEZI